MHYLADEQATLAFAEECASLIDQGGLIFLEGTLGAGKTTLSRGLIRALGHLGAVKSPTYTLVETYQLPSLLLCHFDLYRLGDAEELEFIGIREYLSQGALCLVEWPDKGAGVLPTADMTFTIQDQGAGRSIGWCGHTPKGIAWANSLSQRIEQGAS